MEKMLLELVDVAMKFLRDKSHPEVVEENGNIVLKYSYPLKRYHEIVSLLNNIIERKITSVYDEELFLDMKTFWEADSHVITLSQYDELEGMLSSAFKSLIEDKAEDYAERVMLKLIWGSFCHYSTQKEVVDGLVWCNADLDTLFFNELMSLDDGALKEKAYRAKNFNKMLGCNATSAFLKIKFCIMSLMGLPERKTTHYYTYLGRDKSGLVKIGRSSDPHFREKQMQTGNPSFEVFAIVQEDVEHELHIFYKNKRKFGEWFSLTKDDVSRILKQNTVLFKKD